VYVRHHTGSFAAALVAGAAYSFTPFRVQTIPQPQYLGIQYLPLALLCIDLWLERGRKRWLVGIAASVALQALACVYIGFFTFVVTPVYALVRVWQTGGNRVRTLFGIAGALAGGAVVLIPLALAYLRARESGMIPAWDASWIRNFSWAPWQYVSTGFAFRAGWVTLAIVAVECVGRLVARRSGPTDRVVHEPAPPPSPAPALWAVAATALVLSAGPRLALPFGLDVPLPYELLHAVVPGFSSIRSPLRFSLIVAAMLAPLAGLAVARWTSATSAPLRGLVATGLVTACVFAAAPQPSPVMAANLGEALPAVYAWLASQPEDGPVLEIPAAAVPEGDVIGNVRNGRYMVASTAHGRAIVNGYTAYPPPAAGLLAAAIRELPDPRALAALADATHVRWLVLHRDALTPREAARWPGGSAPAGLTPVATFGTSEVFRVDVAPTRPWYDVIAAGAPPAKTSLEGASTAPLPEACRRGEILAIEAPARTLPIPLPLRIPVRFANRSDCVWPGAGARADGLVGLRYRWLSPSGETTPPGPFSQLLGDVSPGQVVDSAAMVMPPGGAQGAWTLQVELVQNGSPAPLGLATATAVVEIAPPASARAASPPT